MTLKCILLFEHINNDRVWQQFTCCYLCSFDCCLPCLSVALFQEVLYPVYFVLILYPVCLLSCFRRFCIRCTLSSFSTLFVCCSVSGGSVSSVLCPHSLPCLSVVLLQEVLYPVYFVLILHPVCLLLCFRRFCIQCTLSSFSTLFVCFFVSGGSVSRVLRPHSPPCLSVALFQEVLYPVYFVLILYPVCLLSCFRRFCIRCTLSSFSTLFVCCPASGGSVSGVLCPNSLPCLSVALFQEVLYPVYFVLILYPVCLLPCFRRFCIRCTLSSFSTLFVCCSVSGGSVSSVLCPHSLPCLSVALFQEVLYPVYFVLILYPVCLLLCFRRFCIRCTLSSFSTLFVCSPVSGDSVSSVLCPHSLPCLSVALFQEVLYLVYFVLILYHVCLLLCFRRFCIRCTLSSFSTLFVCCSVSGGSVSGVLCPHSLPCLSVSLFQEVLYPVYFVLILYPVCLLPCFRRFCIRCTSSSFSTLFVCRSVSGGSVSSVLCPHSLPCLSVALFQEVLYPVYFVLILYPVCLLLCFRRFCIRCTLSSFSTLFVCFFVSGGSVSGVLCPHSLPCLSVALFQEVLYPVYFVLILYPVCLSPCFRRFCIQCTLSSFSTLFVCFFVSGGSVSGVLCPHSLPCLSVALFQEVLYPVYFVLILYPVCLLPSFRRFCIQCTLSSFSTLFVCFSVSGGSVSRVLCPHSLPCLSVVLFQEVLYPVYFVLILYPVCLLPCFRRFCIWCTLSSFSTLFVCCPVSGGSVSGLICPHSLPCLSVALFQEVLYPVYVVLILYPVCLLLCFRRFCIRCTLSSFSTLFVCCPVSGGSVSGILCPHSLPCLSVALIQEVLYLVYFVLILYPVCLLLCFRRFCIRCTLSSFSTLFVCCPASGGSVSSVLCPHSLPCLSVALFQEELYPVYFVLILYPVCLSLCFRRFCIQCTLSSFSTLVVCCSVSGGSVSGLLCPHSLPCLSVALFQEVLYPVYFVLILYPVCLLPCFRRFCVQCTLSSFSALFVCCSLSGGSVSGVLCPHSLPCLSVALFQEVLYPVYFVLIIYPVCLLLCFRRFCIQCTLSSFSLSSSTSFSRPQSRRFHTSRPLPFPRSFIVGSSTSALTPWRSVILWTE